MAAATAARRVAAIPRVVPPAAAMAILPAVGRVQVTRPAAAWARLPDPPLASGREALPGRVVPQAPAATQGQALPLKRFPTPTRWAILWKVAARWDVRAILTLNVPGI